MSLRQTLSKMSSVQEPSAMVDSVVNGGCGERVGGGSKRGCCLVFAYVPPHRVSALTTCLRSIAKSSVHPIMRPPHIIPAWLCGVVRPSGSRASRLEWVFLSHLLLCTACHSMRTQE